jgi:23S rRNA pseudouridine2457 synthase
VITEEAIAILKVGVEIGFDGSKYITKNAKPVWFMKFLILDLAPKKIRDERHGPTLGIYYC